MKLSIGLSVLFIMISVGCSRGKQPQPRTGETQPISSAATPLDTTPANVRAELSGQPSEPSGEYKVTINVSGVDDYKWKYGASAELNCDSGNGYSAFESASTSITIDLSTRVESIENIAVCAVGRSQGTVQEFPTRISWLWSGEAPEPFADAQLVDGENKVTITMDQFSGEWLVVRSPEELTEIPSNGIDYKVNDTLGNGTVIAIGAAAEYMDQMVANGDTWHYTIFATNEAKRYSRPNRKPITLLVPNLYWIEKNDIQASYTPVEPRGKGDKRYVCRSEHFVDGVSRGVHPGRMFSQNDNLKEGTCRFEFGNAVVASTNYELLMTNKGDPDNLIQWVSSSGDENGSIIPVGSVVGGADVNGQELFVCRVYSGNNVLSFGKASETLNGGCRFMNFSGGVFGAFGSPVFQVLLLK